MERILQQLKTQSSARTSAVMGVQAQLTQLAATLSAVQARLDEKRWPYVTTAAYLGLSDPTVQFEFEVPGNMWLQSEGEVLHKISVYGGAFAVLILAWGVGALQLGNRMEPFFKTKLVVEQVQEERAAQLLALLPAQVRLTQFSMTPIYREVGTGELLERRTVCGLVEVMTTLQSSPGLKKSGKSNPKHSNHAQTSPLLLFNNALENLSDRALYFRASRAEAVGALEIALKAHIFLVTGELLRSA